jgi:hypothetical protein
VRPEFKPPILLRKRERERKRERDVYLLFILFSGFPTPAPDSLLALFCLIFALEED